MVDDKTKGMLLEELWLLIYAVLGTITSYQIGTGAGVLNDTVVTATLVTLVMAVLLAGKFNRKNLEIFFTGALAGMSSLGVISGIWWAWLAGVFVYIFWLILELISSKLPLEGFLHEGGKHGTIAFIAMLIFALINLGLPGGIYPIGNYNNIGQLAIGILICVPAGALATQWIRQNIELGKDSIMACVLTALTGALVLILLTGWFYPMFGAVVTIGQTVFGIPFLAGCIIAMAPENKITDMKDTVITGLIGGGLLIAAWPLMIFGGAPALIALLAVLLYSELIVPFILPGTQNLINKIQEKPAKKTAKKTTKKKTTKKSTAAEEEEE